MSIIGELKDEEIARLMAERDRLKNRVAELEAQVAELFRELADRNKTISENNLAAHLNAERIAAMAALLDRIEHLEHDRDRNDRCTTPGWCIRCQWEDIKRQ